MKYIWSPWRMKYISENERDSECIFCSAVLSSADEENLVLYRGQHAFVIMNLYPYTSGHLMVVPNEHQAVIGAITVEARHELMELIARAESVLDEVYHPEGYNVGANLGAAAGAGIVGHLHFHIVPRWSGDTNFMSTLANTRVLPEALGESYRRLAEHWQKAL
jgi:ATP adenylyltransferase